MSLWSAYRRNAFSGLLITSLVVLTWYMFNTTKRSSIGSPIPNGQIVIVDWTGYNMFSKGDDIELDGCLVTRSRRNISLADAVVVTSRRTKKMSNLPSSSHRNLSQRWVWLMDENPFHTNLWQSFKVRDLNGLFNWTMTYRRDSDVYIPYGWILEKTNLNDISNISANIGKQKNIIIAVVSNCIYTHNGRLKYIRELNKTVPVKLLGNCGKRQCAGFNLARRIQESGCSEAKDYLFYLAFENSNCKDYITEKPFLNAMSFGAVPVVMGPPKTDYEAIMPRNSFIHVADFNSSADLGSYLMHLSKHREEYMQYHEWRKTHYVDSRLQYNDDKIWSHLCDKLKTARWGLSRLPPLEEWFNAKTDCRKLKSSDMI